MNQGNSSQNSQYDGGNVDSPASDHNSMSQVVNSQESLDSTTSTTNNYTGGNPVSEGGRGGTPNSCSSSTTPMDSSNSTSPNVDNNSDITNNNNESQSEKVNFSSAEASSSETPMVTSPTKPEDTSPQAEAGEIEKMSITGSNNVSVASSASVSHNYPNKIIPVLNSGVGGHKHSVSSKQHFRTHAHYTVGGGGNNIQTAGNQIRPITTSRPSNVQQHQQSGMSRSNSLPTMYGNNNTSKIHTIPVLTQQRTNSQPVPRNPPASQPTPSYTTQNQVKEKC